jgi:DNA helicase-2/ATP-dependent DNA helicase PcrA
VTEEIFKDLNPNQRKAVLHKNGPCLIIAGAGTGKTMVISNRIANIIAKKWAKPSEILALTFTEKAAAEMEQRVDILVPYGFTDIQISTFHAFGDRFLREFAISLGLPANFKVLTQTEQAIFMRENIFALDLNHFRPLANPLGHIEALIKHFSRLKDELISPEQYLSWGRNRCKKKPSDEEQRIESEKVIELANAYQRYNDLMIQSGNLDFGDQIFLTYKLLKENPKILRNCRDQYKYILVDEFQDTNFAQNELVKLLSGKNGNITVVGDDDQSIYRFRGASISNILDFKRNYKNTKEIVLNQNYRSTQEILNASYDLITHNNPDRLEVKNKINKKLFSKRKGPVPELLHCDTLSCEADTVVSKILELKKEKGYKNNDFAILCRANSHAEPFIQTMKLQGLPYAFSGASDLFSNPEIKMLIAFLRLLVYSDDNLSFYQLATSELYGIPHDLMTSFYTKSERENRPQVDVALSNIAFAGKWRKTVEDLVEDINEFKKKKNDPAGEVLYEFLNKKRYLKKLTKNPNVESELKVYNVAKLFDRITQFNHASEERGVIAFIKNLELILEAGENTAVSDINPDLDAVNVLTVHAAKGLEWPVVFIVNCVSDRFPSRAKNDPLPIPDELIHESLPKGDFHLEEERRLFYVGATRAKDLLFLSSADDYGGKRIKKLSQFVLELLNEPRPERITRRLSPIQKLEHFKKLKTSNLRLPNRFTDKILKLSRDQIDDYYSCPKKFYFAHIVRIPLLENHNLMYGTAIHGALDHYFSRKISGIAPTLKQLIEDYNQAFRNVGFITREQEEKRHQAGIESLTRFYKEDLKNPIFPKKVEERFEFCEENIKIRGRYDLVCKNSLTDEIIDFKTSRVILQKDADRRIKQSSQMMVYALAWWKKYNVIPVTTLHFIESGLKGQITFKQKDLEKTAEMVKDVAEGIKKADFSASPSQFECRQCPYKDICNEAKI